MNAERRPGQGAASVEAGGPETTIPVAELLEVKPNPSAPGCYLVTIRCPHCGHRHHHGHDGASTQPSHRAAHCLDGRGAGGYYLPALRPCTGRCSSFTIDELVRIGRIHGGCPCAPVVAR